MRYAIVVEAGPDGCSAYAPDLPGCVAFAGTVKEIIALMREALDFHVEGMRLVGEPVPPPDLTLPSITVVSYAPPS